MYQENKLKQIYSLGLILILSCALGKLPIWVNKSDLILSHRKNQMIIKFTPTGLNIYDHGVLNHKYGLQGWFTYTLLPNLIKHFGSIKIETLHLEKPSPKTDDNLILLKKFIDIKTVINE